MTLWELIDRACERRVKMAIERPVNPRLLANVIGFGLITGFLGALFALFAVSIPPPNEQIITYMIGQLSGFAGGIVAYHYTQNSREQQQQQLEAVRTSNTGKLADAVTAALGASPVPDPKPDVILKPGETAQAAEFTGVRAPPMDDTIPPPPPPRK